DDRLHDPDLLFVHSDLGEIEEHRALVEKTHHDALAVDGGRGRETDVDVASGQLYSNAAVLRQAFLGDVEAAHDLDARDDRILKPLRRTNDLLQNAVDAEPHADVLLLRLDVDIGGA